MLIGINAENIQVGDVIRTTSGVSGTVTRYLGFKQRLNMMEFSLDCMGDQPLHLRVLEIVELLHRPLPVGMLGRDPLEDVETCMIRVDHRAYVEKADPSEEVAALRRAIEVYELGKPVELAKREQRNEPLVDRHMTP